MNSDRIEAGDIVHVDINCAQITISHRASVEYMPAGAGDSWIFKDIDSGNIHYISEGCTITKLQSDQPR